MSNLYARFFYNRFKPCFLALMLPVLLVLANGTAFAQQKLIGFTQYADNLTAFNPAYAMLDKAGSVSTVLGRQFVEIQDGAPTNLLLNVNLPFEGINGAGGIIVKNNTIGSETLTEINAFFAKSVQLSGSNFLAVSLNAGLRKYVDQNPDPTDPEFTDIRQTNPNVGFGIMFYSDEYYLGLSLPELTIKSLGTASYQNPVDLRNHYYFTGAILEPLSDDDFKVKPSFLIAYANGAGVLAGIATTLYIKDMLGIGAAYRTDKQIAGILSYTLNNFRLGYSYQTGTASNNFGGINSATHEVSLSYRFGGSGGALEPKLL